MGDDRFPLAKVVGPYCYYTVRTLILFSPLENSLDCVIDAEMATLNQLLVGKHILRYLDVKCILLFVLVKHVRAPSIDQREARQRARSAVFFPPAVRYGNAATRHRTGTTGYSYK